MTGPLASREPRAGTPPARRGFTLVELLAAVAIVGVLAAVLLPVLAGTKLSGQAASSSNNLRELAAANVAYAADHGGIFCPAQDRYNLVRWHGARTSASGAFDPTKGYLSPYLCNDGRVKIDPLFHDMITGSQSFENGTGGYGYNATYIGGTPANTYQPNRQANISRPVQTVMFTTTALANGDGVQEYGFCEPPFWPDPSGEPAGYRPTPSVHFRFRGQALVAWCDGHVSAEKSQKREVGDNPYGGDADTHNLGWFGPDAGNGFWNPNYDPSAQGTH